MTDESRKIKLFDAQQVRAEWDAEAEKWWFSVVDILAILTESVDAMAYWRKLKQRLKAEGNETVTSCHGFMNSSSKAPALAWHRCTRRAATRNSWRCSTRRRSSGGTTCDGV
jgi:hypothetical protein